MVVNKAGKNNISLLYSFISRILYMYEFSIVTLSGYDAFAKTKYLTINRNIH